MLIPRFTIRNILVAMAGFGLFFVVLAQAVRQNHWAIATAIAIGGVVLALFLQVTLYLVVVLVQSLWNSRGPRTRSGSPFASAGPPPQVIPQIEPNE